MNLSKKYAKSKEKKWTLRFKTAHPDRSYYYGVVTHIKRSFIVMRELRELDFDGVLILPKKVLKGYRDSKFEEAQNRVIRHSGNIKKARAPKWLNNCDSLIDVVEQIRKRDIWPAIEILHELDRKIETDFFIGKITRTDKDRFWIHDYDATGRWGNEYEIDTDEVFNIQFDDAYSTQFNAYMRTLGRPEPKNTY